MASSYHYDPLPPPPTFSSPTDPTHPHPSPSLQVRPKIYPNKKPIGTIAALDRGACVRSPWFDPSPPSLLLLLPSSISTTCKRHQGGPGGDAGAYQVVAKVMRAIGIIQFNWTINYTNYKIARPRQGCRWISSSSNSIAMRRNIYVKERCKYMLLESYNLSGLHIS